MTYRAVLRCIAGCPAEHSLFSSLYRCPTCDNLLEVAHDLDALRSRAPGAWIRLFDEPLQAHDVALWIVGLG